MEGHDWQPQGWNKVPAVTQKQNKVLADQARQESGLASGSSSSFHRTLASRAPLHRLVEAGDLHGVRALLAQIPRTGTPALDLLLQVNKDVQTPLDLALEMCSLPLVEALLLPCKEPDAIEALLSRSGPTPPLFHALSGATWDDPQSCCRILELLLEPTTGNLQYRLGNFGIDAQNTTLLHLAAGVPHVSRMVLKKVLEWSLPLGWLSFRDNDDRLPIHIALEGKNADYFYLLLEHMERNENLRFSLMSSCKKHEFYELLDELRSERWKESPAPLFAPAGGKRILDVNLSVVERTVECPYVDMQRVHSDDYLTRAQQRDTNKFATARKEAGAVLAAIDLVAREDASLAYCYVQPDSGALGINGPKSPTGTILNHAAVGAAYARCVHRHTFSRVAIVDNAFAGTESIVQHLEPSQLPPSEEIHDIQVGSGASVQVVVKQLALRKLWLDTDDASNVLFCGPADDGTLITVPKSSHTDMLPLLQDFAPGLIILAAPVADISALRTIAPVVALFAGVDDLLDAVPTIERNAPVLPPLLLPIKISKRETRRLARLASDASSSAAHKSGLSSPSAGTALWDKELWSDSDAGAFHDSDVDNFNNWDNEDAALPEDFIDPEAMDLLGAEYLEEDLFGASDDSSPTVPWDDNTDTTAPWDDVDQPWNMVDENQWSLMQMGNSDNCDGEQLINEEWIAENTDLDLHVMSDAAETAALATPERESIAMESHNENVGGNGRAGGSIEKELLPLLCDDDNGIAVAATSSHPIIADREPTHVQEMHLELLNMCAQNYNDFPDPTWQNSQIDSYASTVQHRKCQRRNSTDEAHLALLNLGTSYNDEDIPVKRRRIDTSSPQSNSSGEHATRARCLQRPELLTYDDVDAAVEEEE